MATNKLITVPTLDEFKTKIEDEIPDSVQYSTMPTASADLVGEIVQYTGEDAPGLGYDLINGHWYKCESWGTGYIWTDLYTDNISNSSKPVISSAVSSALQAKQNIIQVAEMPVASSTRVGDILQYIGTTTASYTNGYFYKCVPGSTSGTYQWTPVSVQSGGGGGGGEDARPKIFKNVTVYRSSDFEKLSDGSYNYPCVHFQGKSSGKILMIKIVDEPLASSVSLGLNLGSVFNYMRHFGGNLSDGILYNTSNKQASTFTTGGVTFTKLPEGGIRVSGTSTANIVLRIGTLVCPETFAGTVRCYGLTGTYEGLKLGAGYTSYDATYYNNTACPLDETTTWATLLITQSINKTYLTLYIPKGKTFDCEFYPMVCWKWEENDHYERPFSVNNLNFLKHTPADDSVYAKDASTTISYFYEQTHRTVSRYSIDYPVVHDGENTFAIYDTSASNVYRACNFEVYYTEDNIERAEFGGYLTSDLDSEYEYAKDLLLEKTLLLPLVGGSVTQHTTQNYMLVSSIYFTKQSSVLPSKIYYGLAPTTDTTVGYRYRRCDFNNSLNRVQKSEDFVFDSSGAYDERLRLWFGSSISANATVYYGIVCDYSGFDDSTTIT